MHAVALLVGQAPGLNFSEIGGRLGMRWEAVDYHVHRLVGLGVVEVERDGKEWRVFPKAYPRLHRRWAIASRGAHPLLAALADGPRSGTTELSRRAGISPLAAKRLLRGLVAAGAVERQGTLRPRFSLAPGVAAWLAGQQDAGAAKAYSVSIPSA